MAEIPFQNTFLIEIRLARTKWRIKRTTERITSLFPITEFAERHPHVTLFGPFSLKNGISVPLLFKAVEAAAGHFSSIPFLIDGYDMNQGLNGAVIAYRVLPSDLLIDLNSAVSRAVSPLAETVNVWDTDPDRKWFHVTIANRLERKEGSVIYEHLTGQRPIAEKQDRAAQHPFRGNTASAGEGEGSDPQVLPRPPVLDEDGIRISVINGEEILAEYDLLRHRWFSPRALHAASEWRRSLELFRKERGFELVAPQYSRRREVFVISDLHLSHANIIRYCSRPFPHDAAGEMDRVLIRNWNYTVRAGDRVYHLGDLCHRPPDRGRPDYIRRLNGSITLVAGNQDPQGGPSRQAEYLTWEGIPFTLVHDPADAPPVPGTWVIHGHHHNNDLATYPFISFLHRRINVSAEVVRYRPVSLTGLASIIREYPARPAVNRILLREN